MKYISILLLSLIASSLFSQSKSEKSFLDGKNKFQKKSYKDALESFNEALLIDNKLSIVYYWRGKTKVELKDYTGASIDFGKYLKKDSNHVSSLILRGDCFTYTKKYDAAFKDFNKAEKLSPDNDTIYNFRGYAYYNTNKAELAVKDFTKSIELNPKNSLTYYGRALAYNTLKQTDLELADLEKTIELDPKDAMAKMSLAYCYLIKEDFTKANTLYEDLYKHDKKSPIILNNYGYAKFKMGDDKKAESLINQSIDLWPQNSYAFRNLALVYLKQERKEDACEAMKQGIVLGFSKKYGPELENLRKENCLKK